MNNLKIKNYFIQCEMIEQTSTPQIALEQNALATPLEMNKIKAELTLATQVTKTGGPGQSPSVRTSSLALVQETLPQNETMSVRTSSLALAQGTELSDKDFTLPKSVIEHSIPENELIKQKKISLQSSTDKFDDNNNIMNKSIIQKDELKDLIESNKKFSNTTRDIDIQHREETFSNRVMEEESYSDSNLDYSEAEPIPSRYQKNTKTFVPELIIEDKTGSASINFESLSDLKKYYDKHRDSYSQMPTQKINKLLHCDGYKFSKSGGIFKIVIDNNENSSTTSKNRETWKNKSIELEKSIQILQQENLRLSEDVNALANKLIKAYSKISSQSRDIENLTKVVTNMYETQIPALTNKINKLKLANKYAH